MKGSDFEDFSDFETDALLTGSKQRNWLWFGLLVSLGLHLALCAYFYRTHFQPANALLLEGLPLDPSELVSRVQGFMLEAAEKRS